MTLRESEKQRSVLESRPSKHVHRPRRLRATPRCGQWFVKPS